MSSQLAAWEGNTRHPSAFILLRWLSAAGMAKEGVASAPDTTALPRAAAGLFSGLCWASPRQRTQQQSRAPTAEEIASMGSSAASNNQGRAGEQNEGTNSFSSRFSEVVSPPLGGAKGWSLGSHA